MRVLPHTAAVHGVLMRVFNVGVLIIGDSGVGKSDLALSLLDRGHALVADDLVEFSLMDEGSLLGSASPLSKNFLEVYGLGVLNIAALFGAEAVLEKEQLSLVVKLEKSVLLSREITFKSTPWSLLGVALPCFSLPICEGRPREVLAEALVRNYQLIQKGYDANSDFLGNHHNALSTFA